MARENEDSSILTAWAATRNKNERERHFGMLQSALGKHLNIVRDVCERLGADDVVRWLAHHRHKQQADSVTPPMERRGDEIWWGEHRLGTVLRLYRAPMPYDIQTHIAYDTFIARFFKWLACKYTVLALATNDATTDLFVPDGKEMPDLGTAWKDFVDYAFSTKQLLDSFVLLVNSALLADRGFSVPEVPIVTRDQADILIAFVVAATKAIERSLDNVKERAENAADEKDRKKAEKVYGSYRKAVDDVRAELNRLPREQQERIKQLSHRFTIIATRQMKQVTAIVGKFAYYVGKWATSGQDFIIPQLVANESLPLDMRVAGDTAEASCYACGQRLPPKKRSAPREHVYKANKLIFRSPSQTRQSVLRQTEPEVCGTCAALAVASPIKQLDAGLVISLKDSSEQGQEDGTYLYDRQLRMLTVAEMSIAAGRYLMIPCTESAPGNKPLIKTLGGQEYALLKVASLFPADALRRYQVETIIDGDPVALPQRHTVALRYLLEAFHLRIDSLDKDKALFSSVGAAIRYIERDQLNFAIYRLVTAISRPLTEVDRVILEDGRKTFTERLRMEGHSDTAQQLNDVAALTGILYAFINRVRFDYQRRPPTDAKEAKRELHKLIEQVGNPHHFTYALATHATDWNSVSATLSRTQHTHYVFDQAKVLLGYLVGDEGLTTREMREDGKYSLVFNLDDIAEAYARLFSGAYASEKAQRDLTYELQLSLYSRFPDLVSSDERGESNAGKQST